MPSFAKRAMIEKIPVLSMPTQYSDCMLHAPEPQKVIAAIQCWEE